MKVRQIYPENRVVLREVGLRDGLQLTKGFPDTAQKLAWLRAEQAAGVRHFELGSFLSQKHFPQFADLRDLIAAVAPVPGCYSSALTLNERGVADALHTDVDEIVFVMSATESHSQANTRRSRAEAVQMLTRINAQRRECEDPPVLMAGIAMAFGCSLEGQVDPDAVLRLAEDCARAGADVIALADTVGFGGPRQVAALADAINAALGADMPVAMHFHDTRGLALANCAAALDHGIRVLDGSLAGLGGCPFAPGATGNAVFEDMAFLCDSMGFDTGIDVAALKPARAILESALPHEELHGALARAGLPKVSEPA